jgi:Na+-transporting methylmalonyl-CoA/oxaloacetate decarboxylase gamma subunit
MEKILEGIKKGGHVLVLGVGLFFVFLTYLIYLEKPYKVNSKIVTIK